MRRMHVTVARLRDVKLHAIRINGHLHVTGMTVHGALVVPTRTFWAALAACAGNEEPDFGDEYAFYRQCANVLGDCRLYFTVTVHHDKAALLTDVEDPSRVVGKRPASPRQALQTIRPRLFPGRSITDMDRDGLKSEFWEEDSNVDDHHEWPLLAACESETKSHCLWGWESCRLPQGEFTELLNGPEGTLRPSRN